MHARHILTIHPVAFWEEGDDGALVEDPHPELVDHDDPGHLLDSFATG